MCTEIGSEWLSSGYAAVQCVKKSDSLGADRRVGAIRPPLHLVSYLHPTHYILCSEGEPAPHAADLLMR